MRHKGKAPNFRRQGASGFVMQTVESVCLPFFLPAPGTNIDLPALYPERQTARAIGAL